MWTAIQAHPRRLLLFIILSCLDMFFTWQLLETTHGKVYESNPVASAWLAHYGWAGLAIYKSAMVFLIVASTVFISLYRPQTSGRILTFGCLVTGATVLYGYYLTHYFDREGQALLADEAPPLDDWYFIRQFRDQQQQRNEYRRWLEQLGVELLYTRPTLDHVVGHLALWRHADHPGRLARLLRHQRLWNPEPISPSPEHHRTAGVDGSSRTNTSAQDDGLIVPVMPGILAIAEPPAAGHLALRMMTNSRKE